MILALAYMIKKIMYDSLDPILAEKNTFDDKVVTAYRLQHEIYLSN